MAGSKPSFASVAAMAPPVLKPRPKREEIARDKGKQSPFHTKIDINPISSRLPGELVDSMSRLDVADGSSSVKSTTELENNVAIRTSLRFDDEQTHVSSSSTKPASIDGKSTASGATFALDEKESLRPDDSASVKAAEEDDSCSGPGSGAPSSRVGSEAGGRAFRDQFNEISERIGHGPVRPIFTGRREIPGIEEEGRHSSLAPISNPLPPPMAMPGVVSLPPNGAPYSMEYKDPDEKLLEALTSPKDRLFILRLEHEIITFIQDSKTETLDLPPCNSFCRLLAHKLADYYALTHQVDNAVTAVRLQKTPFCKIRMPLSKFAQGQILADGPSVQPAMKIMRRTGPGKDGQFADSGPNTTESSKAPSKAGSEIGDDSGHATGVVSPTESSLAKDKVSMTREEREAKYKETRERIFKDFGDNENADASNNGEDGSAISRTSSATGKKKSRRQRNNDDGFEARSQFSPYYPAMQYPVSPIDPAMSPSAYFNPYVPQPTATFGQSGALGSALYPHGYVPGYQAPTSVPGYPIPMQHYQVSNGQTMNAANGVNPLSGYVQQMPSQYYQQPHQSPAVDQQSPAMSSPALSNSTQLSQPPNPISDQHWAQMPYQYAHQHQQQNQQQFLPPQSQDRGPIQSNSTVPYQYGQLPVQPQFPGSRNAHPLPGSYNRLQAFNPQIRSFVPSSVPQAPVYGNRPNELMTVGQLNVTMSSQGVANTIPSGPLGPPISLLQFGSFNQPVETKTHTPRKEQPNSSNENQLPSQSSLAKWGTPATLPPKPPPPATPSLPEGRHSLPQNVPTPHTNIHVLSNGQPMPTFHNGVYSMPSQHTQ